MLSTARISATLFVASAIMLTMTFWVRAEGQATTQPSASATGVWKWTAPGRGGDMETTLTLKQDGDKLTGNITGFGGDAQDISDGTIKDGKVSFKVTNNFGGGGGGGAAQQFVTLYTATLDGDSLKGKSEIVISRDFEGKRSQ